jgi:hypothetical protein
LVVAVPPPVLARCPIFWNQSSHFSNRTEKGFTDSRHPDTCTLVSGMGSGFCFNPRDRWIADRNAILLKLLLLGNFGELFPTYVFFSQPKFIITIFAPLFYNFGYIIKIWHFNLSIHAQNFVLKQLYWNIPAVHTILCLRFCHCRVL